MLGVYRNFMESWIAMPVLTGLKSESEKFAGALRTYACEALMQDNRALQAGTSHNLGQNFAKQFELKFQSVEGREEYAWNTSWGTSTRMVGGMVMTHGDDAGAVVPPRLAPIQVVIVPIWKTDEERTAVIEKSHAVAARLKEDGLRVKVDDRDQLSPGSKYFEWERKGVPFRVEVGPKDLAKGQLALAKRVRVEGAPRKEFLPEGQAVGEMSARLHAFQDELLAAAVARREANSHRGVTSIDEAVEILNTKGGFVYSGWSGDPKVEARMKEAAKATIRVIPDEEFRSDTAPDRCLGGDAASTMEVVWAKAY